ncbi:MAG TPA: glycosyltransferase 87 family protein, partial [Cyclobacteriaceae bacterium]|nr:glycosyltransferase 87 family protein [Cyclobacteriaceae bacterium]
MEGLFKPGTRVLQNRWNVVLLVMAAAVMITGVVKGGFHLLHNDFSTAYGSAQNLVAGKPLYYPGGWYVYPPLYAFLMTPFTFFSQFTARWIWVLLNLPMIGISAVLAYRTWSFGLKLSASRWQ